MSGWRVFEDESLEEDDGVNFLAESGLDKAGEDAVDKSACLGAIAESDFSEDDRRAEGAFCMIISGICVGKFEEGEPVVFFFDESFTEGFCIMKQQRLGADFFKLSGPAFCDVF